MREMKLTTESDEVKSPNEEFKRKWREKTKMVLVDNEMRKRKQLKAQMQEEGRQQRKEDEELSERKRKREHEVAWEQSRDQRIGSWRDFQKGPVKANGAAGGGEKKKKKLKPIG